jgi:hypothetical protein
MMAILFSLVLLSGLRLPPPSHKHAIQYVARLYRIVGDEFSEVGFFRGDKCLGIVRDVTVKGNYTTAANGVAAIGPGPGLVFLSPTHARRALNKTTIAIPDDAIAVSPNGRYEAEFQCWKDTLEVFDIAQRSKVLSYSAAALRRLGLPTVVGIMGSDTGLAFSPDSKSVLATFPRSTPNRDRGEAGELSSVVVRIPVQGKGLPVIAAKDATTVGFCSGHPVLIWDSDTLGCGAHRMKIPDAAVVACNSRWILTYTDPASAPHQAKLTLLDWRLKRIGEPILVPRPKMPSLLNDLPLSIDLISVEGE